MEIFLFEGLDEEPPALDPEDSDCGALLQNASAADGIPVFSVHGHLAGGIE